MSLVYLFAASKMEGQPVERIAANPHTRSSQDFPSELVRMSSFSSRAVGPKGARAKATATFDRASGGKPDAVLIIGLYGSLSSSLPESRIVAYTDYRD